MDIIKSILMGIIQGVTEFLPVSSSGHLSIFQNIFKMNLDSGVYFDVMLHLGTLVALIIVFREDIVGIIREFFGIIATAFANLIIFIKRRKGDSRYTYFKVINSAYRKLVLMIIISTIPTGILGMVGSELVDRASKSLWAVGSCLIVTSVLLFIADKQSNGDIRVKEATYSSAFILGIAQGVATLPGLSRSGTTIATGMIVGYNKKLALKYSFLMSIPAILGAVIVKIGDLKGEAFGSANLPGYLIGTIVAGVTGFFSLKYMLKFIKNKRYIGFSIYCLCLGLFVIGYSIISKVIGR